MTWTLVVIAMLTGTANGVGGVSVHVDASTKFTSEKACEVAAKAVGVGATRLDFPSPANPLAAVYVVRATCVANQ
jgi:hypothetical protein